MGGGDQFPSAGTVHELVQLAQSAESQGQYEQAIANYRRASDAVLVISKGQGLTDDERYVLQLQSEEFINKANSLQNTQRQGQGQSQQIPNTNTIAPVATNRDVSIAEAQTAQGENSTPSSTTSEETGACIVGATGGFCFGSLVGAPLFGAIAGGVFGGVAAVRDDEHGERARKIGKFGAKAVDKTFEINKKYNVVGNIKVGAQSLLYKARQIDREHNVVGTVAQATGKAWERATQFEREHNLTERAAQAVKGTVDTAKDVDKKYGISTKVSQKVSSFTAPGPQEPSQ